MGRAERELDPSSGPVQRFAYDLRLLRRQAGSPSYRELSRRAQYAPSVLSRAASGRDLPSRNVTLAYVAACGGDTGAWQERWTALAAAQHEADGVGRPAAAGGDSGTSQSATPQPPAAWPRTSRPGTPSGGWRVLRRLPGSLLIAAVGAALGAIAVAAIGSAPAPSRPRISPLESNTPGRSAGTVSPRDGVDPVTAGCAGDATTIATADIRLSRPMAAAHTVLPAGAVIGIVELRYSPDCRAGWSRVTPAGIVSHVRTGAVEALVSRDSDNTHSVFGAGKVTVFYTDLLLMNGSCLRASGTIMIGEMRGTAQTTCQPVPSR